MELLGQSASKASCKLQQKKGPSGCQLIALQQAAACHLDHKGDVERTGRVPRLKLLWCPANSGSFKALLLTLPTFDHRPRAHDRNRPQLKRQQKGASTATRSTGHPAACSPCSGSGHPLPPRPPTRSAAPQTSTRLHSLCKQHGGGRSLHERRQSGGGGRQLRAGHEPGDRRGSLHPDDHSAHLEDAHAGRGAVRRRALKRVGSRRALEAN